MGKWFLPSLFDLLPVSGTEVVEGGGDGVSGLVSDNDNDDDEKDSVRDKTMKNRMWCLFD